MKADNKIAVDFLAQIISPRPPCGLVRLVRRIYIKSNLKPQRDFSAATGLR